MSTSNETFFKRTIKNSTSGTVAGIALCLTGHPFDTIKVRLQMQPSQSRLYNGVWDCFVKTLKWEGVGGLYKGVGSPLVGQMIFRAVLFVSYYQITSIFQGSRPLGERLAVHEYFISGACTGLVISTVESPIDLFKTKMQVQIMKRRSEGAVVYRNVFSASYAIVSQYGLRGAYQGFSGAIMRNVPANMFAFGILEYTRLLFTPAGGTIKDISNGRLLLSGALASICYWMFIYPVDVVKSALHSDHSDRQRRQYRGFVDCVTKLYKADGITRFYRGFVPCMMRAPLAAAVLFSVAEKCRQWFS